MIRAVSVFPGGLRLRPLCLLHRGRQYGGGLTKPTYFFFPFGLRSESQAFSESKPSLASGI